MKREKVKFDQYLFTPPTQEHLDELKREDEERHASYDYVNLPPDVEMPYNNNGRESLFDPRSIDCEIEHMEMHRYAVSLIEKSPEAPAWEIYERVANAYKKHIATGAVPSVALDPTSLLQE